MRELLARLVQEEEAFRAEHQRSPNLEELSPQLYADLEATVTAPVFVRGLSDTKMFLEQF